LFTVTEDPSSHVIVAVPSPLSATVQLLPFRPAGPSQPANVAVTAMSNVIPYLDMLYLREEQVIWVQIALRQAGAAKTIEVS